MISNREYPNIISAMLHTIKVNNNKYDFIYSRQQSGKTQFKPSNNSAENIELNATT